MVPLLQANIQSNGLEAICYEATVFPIAIPIELGDFQAGEDSLGYQEHCRITTLQTPGQDHVDAIELNWGDAPAISGINTVIMSATC